MPFLPATFLVTTPAFAQPRFSPDALSDVPETSARSLVVGVSVRNGFSQDSVKPAVAAHIYAARIGQFSNVISGQTGSSRNETPFRLRSPWAPAY